MAVAASVGTSGDTDVDVAVSVGTPVSVGVDVRVGVGIGDGSGVDGMGAGTKNKAIAATKPTTVATLANTCNVLPLIQPFLTARNSPTEIKTRGIATAIFMNLLLFQLP